MNNQSLKNLTTHRADFYRSSRDLGSEMCQVKEGLPLVTTLENASCLLAACEELTFCDSDGLSHDAVYGLRSIIIQAKGLVDAVEGALEFPNRGAEQ